MDKETQIEEMTQNINDVCENKGCNEYRDCGKCHAEWLYKLGYRKKSEVAEEIFKLLEAISGRKDGLIVYADEYVQFKKKYLGESGNDR